MNIKHSIGGIFCDLEKAFDCMDHDTLLSKLKSYGITGRDYALYESYLSNGYMKTVIYNDASSRVLDWLRTRH
jgi:hypothetical protein